MIKLKLKLVEGQIWEPIVGSPGDDYPRLIIEVKGVLVKYRLLSHGTPVFTPRQCSASAFQQWVYGSGAVLKQ